jgi:DNA invertase Pin-like site-specific DNA recombinase
MMQPSAKIRPEHLGRRALIYIRQSTMIQVIEHRQSTERQYNLGALAQQMGWHSTQIEVIDEDLAHSGESAASRAGFQRLVADVSLGKVGAIFSLEVSRFARSSADWHRLLDLCALFDTLIVDDDGVYDPNDFNDRLILGMKGTMSDAERHVMRLRLQGGKLHKARKGELVFTPPTGYVFDDKGILIPDPDEQVGKSVRLLFERFHLGGSSTAVVRYFNDHGLRFPARVAHKGGPDELRWQPLTRSRALSILRNPFYAGAYAYGRRKERRRLVDGVIRKGRQTVVPRDQWHVLHRDAHPGYITWEEYTENLKRLDEHAAKTPALHRKGAPREGEALLQGLVLCGRCGRRMHSMYPSTWRPAYECPRNMTVQSRCWATAARRIDEKVAAIFLEAVAPPEIDLSLAVLKEVERQGTEIDQQWKLRLERARYEAGRAERHYKAVEPENRLVARTLETQWNQKLEELAQVEREYEDARRGRKLVLDADDRRAVMALAKDLPKVWSAPTTTPADRKQLLRLVIEDVVLAPVDVPTRSTKITILWKTGATTEALVPRPDRIEAARTPTSVLVAIRELAAQKLTDDQVASALNLRGLTPARARRFTKGGVATIRDNHEIPPGRKTGGGKPTPEKDAFGRYSIRGLAARYGVSEGTVRYWVEKGLLHPQEKSKGLPRWFAIDREVEARISAQMLRCRSRPTGPTGQQAQTRR